jgi:hypothetical protein
MMTQSTHLAFVTAEVDYRLARARSQYGRPTSRPRVPRRPLLWLPRPRRRPVAVA